jgi:hypothetical protein
MTPSDSGYYDDHPAHAQFLRCHARLRARGIEVPTPAQIMAEAEREIDPDAYGRIGRA